MCGTSANRARRRRGRFLPGAETGKLGVLTHQPELFSEQTPHASDPPAARDARGAVCDERSASEGGRAAREAGRREAGESREAGSGGIRTGGEGEESSSQEGQGENRETRKVKPMAAVTIHVVQAFEQRD